MHGGQAGQALGLAEAGGWKFKNRRSTGGAKWSMAGKMAAWARYAGSNRRAASFKIMAAAGKRRARRLTSTLLTLQGHWKWQ